MENIEIILALVGLGSAASVKIIEWLLNRVRQEHENKKTEAETAELINRVAGDLVENVRKEMTEMQARLDKVEIKSESLMTILRKWAVGIQQLIDQIKEHGGVPCWTPDPEDLKKVE